MYWQTKYEYEAHTFQTLAKFSVLNQAIIGMYDDAIDNNSIQFKLSYATLMKEKLDKEKLQIDDK